MFVTEHQALNCQNWRVSSFDVINSVLNRGSTGREGYRA